MLRNIKLAFWGGLIALTALWLAANLPFSASADFIAIRDLFLQYSGVIAIGVMSIAMVLATRPKFLEPLLNGLDKSYRLHKWLGITGLVMAILHWAGKNAPTWAISLRLMEAPERGKPPMMGGEDAAFSLEQLFLGLKHTAEFVGEWAFYGVVVLIALALIKRFKYKWFAKTHLIIAVAYLALVFHAVILFEYSLWLSPLGFVTALLLLAGTISAVIVLLRQVGKRHKVTGVIEEQIEFKEMNIMETTLKLQPGWSGHKAGQFAFVTFDKKEGAHPFTIASSWDDSSSRITFITKALGDYTEQLPEELTVGQHAVVEGPYGGFTFEDTAERQIWIGGGIGITPFIARMKELAASGNKQQIDLFHSTTKLAPEALSKLQEDVKGSNVNLHLIVDGEDCLLTGERLRSMIPDWKSASVWFCGPSGFGKAIRTDLVQQGLEPKHFHQELFEMR